MDGGFPSQGNLATVHSEDPWVSPRSRLPGTHLGTREESELHQTQSHVLRKIEDFQNTRLALVKVGQGKGRRTPTPLAMSPPPSIASEPPRAVASHE